MSAARIEDWATRSLYRSAFRRIAAMALLAFAVGFPLHAEEEEPDSPKITEDPIHEVDRDHWAYKLIEQPTLPDVQDAEWCRNPIDRFILARLDEKGLEPIGEASRQTLIRRLSFDLTGLPPSPAEVKQFVNDNRQDAYERLVDRLLASRAHGERMAQHWLDLARFAETDGFEHDKVRSQAWKYRDWVIEAFHADMPYDQFVRMQLAGDELFPEDEAAAIATGFCLCGPDMPDINLQEERRHVLLNELTGTIGAAFLGLQVGCAECHDHKYDAISQADFYRLRAFFSTTDVFGKKDKPRVLVETSAKPKPAHLMIRGDFRRQGPEVPPAFPRIVNYWDAKVPAPAADAKSTGHRTALARWLTRPDHPLTTRVIANRLWQYHFVEPLARTPSDFGVVGEEPSHPELLDWLAAELPRRGWSLKAMTRLMVTSSTYRQATHASEPNWMPNEQKLAAGRLGRAKEADPQNKLLARMRRRRLDGESIRDAMLASSNRLSPRTGGRGVMPPLPDELVSTLLKGQWKTSPDEEDHRRRSIYLFVRRNLRYPLFEVFDRPDTNATCPRRNVSTVAPQALLLLNSEFSLASAQDLAGYVLSQLEAQADAKAKVSLCYQRALCRPPTEQELELGLEFLTAQAALVSSEQRQQFALPRPAPKDLPAHRGAALVDFCLALFNSNEFVYVD